MSFNSVFVIMSDLVPYTVQLADPNQHFIAGRGKSLGGITGLVVYVASYALWVYFWGVFAATTILFIRSDYDIKETLGNMVRLIVHPFVAVPMELLVVLPYKYILCPLDRWWAGVTIWRFKKGTTLFNELTPAQQTKEMEDLAKYDKGLVQKINADAEIVWENDSNLNKGISWANPLNITNSILPPGSYNYEWTLPESNPERLFLNQVYEDYAQPIYDGKHGYKAPRYCKLPGEPFSAGCDPFKVGFPTSIFSLSWWFCRSSSLKTCTVPCKRPP